MNYVTEDWTPEARERLLALIAIRDPRWLCPLMWVLIHVPGTTGLRRRLDRWQEARAVRKYRARVRRQIRP